MLIVVNLFRREQSFSTNSTQNAGPIITVQEFEQSIFCSYFLLGKLLQGISL